MTTLKAIRQECLRRAGPSIGEVVSLTGAASTTATASSLIYGQSNQTYQGKWLLRPDSASQPADRLRIVASFVGTTGVFTLVSGATYADTTSTSETLEIHQYNPWILDNAIQTTIERLRRIDRYDIPSRQTTRYYLGNADWIIDPALVERVTWTPSPVLNRNREFKQWNTTDTNGLQRPDGWTWSGTASDLSRDNTHIRRGTYAVKLAGQGTLSQEIGILDAGTDGTDGSDLRSKSVTMNAMVWAANAATINVALTDDAGTTSGTAHTGDSSFQEITVVRTVDADADTLTAKIVVTATHDVWVADAYVTQTVSMGDSVRRNNYDNLEINIPDFRFDQGAGELAIQLPNRGLGGQYRIYAQRPYAAFDPTRLAAGTADADTTDAPLEIVVCGALARMYENLASQQGVDATKFQQEQAKWGYRYQQLAERHLGLRDAARGGINLPRYTGVPVGTRWR